jgi:hypothetical protein
MSTQNKNTKDENKVQQAPQPQPTMDMTSRIDYDSYMPKPQEKNSAQADAYVARMSQEVQVAMLAAKRFPRDPYEAFQKIMKACDRKLLAEEAMYEYPRGGNKITGPSIRLAEAVSQNWGNIDSGVVELEQKNGVSTVMAYAWDLETNTRDVKIFTVAHERKANNTIKKLDDPRDIYELVANMGARRKRACIMAVIPGDIVEAAVERCKDTLKKDGIPLEDKIRQMLGFFQNSFQVSKEMLEKYIGCRAEAFTINDILRLRGVYKSLTDGMGKREDYFDIPAPAQGATEGAPTKAEQAFMNATGIDDAGKQAGNSGKDVFDAIKDASEGGK